MRAKMPEAKGHGLYTADGRHPVVIVIDSNRSTAAVASMLAEQFGCRALPLSTASAAVRVLKEGQTIDLILIDFGIGDMNPVAAARLIHTVDLRGATPIIAIDDKAHVGVQSRERDLFAGTVTKPYSPRELFTALEKSLGPAPAGLSAPSRH